MLLHNSPRDQEARFLKEILKSVPSTQPSKFSCNCTACVVNLSGSLPAASKSTHGCPQGMKLMVETPSPRGIALPKLRQGTHEEFHIRAAFGLVVLVVIRCCPFLENTVLRGKESILCLAEIVAISAATA